MVLDMFVISGAKEWPCQACGIELLPIEYNDITCKCGQVWRITYCTGDPFARMSLEKDGMSQQVGDPYYNAGYLVKAI